MDLLGSGESAYCVCSHHITDHEPGLEIKLNIDTDKRIWAWCKIKTCSCGCFKPYRNDYITLYTIQPHET